MVRNIYCDFSIMNTRWKSAAKAIVDKVTIYSQVINREPPSVDILTRQMWINSLPCTD